MPQGGGNIVLTLRLLAKIIFALVSAEMSKLTAFKQRHFYGRSKIISLRQQSNASAQYHRRPAASKIIFVLTVVSKIFPIAGRISC